MPRLFPAVLCAAVLVPAASASATQFYVTSTGSGSDCTLASPCATIADALAAHRVAPAVGDIITIGAGTFVENVVADDPNDNGLIIQGTVSGGSRQTTIRASGSGATGCLADPCAVILGTVTSAVQLRDVDVDTNGASNGITPISLEGGSDLRRMDVTSHAGDDVGQMVITCDDVGTVLEAVTIDVASSDADATGVDIEEGVKIVDSHIIEDSGVAVQQVGSTATAPTIIRRSWLEASSSSGNPGVVSNGDLIIDSSLLTGGGFGAIFTGTNGGTWSIYNSTIDALTPDAFDSGTSDVFIVSVNGNPDPTIDINSSILADEVSWFQPGGNEGGGTLTCEYSNIGNIAAATSPADSSGCVSGAGTVTTSDPADQFVGSGSWALKATAPARDSGDPTSVSTFSAKDITGGARERVSYSGNCGSPPQRDMGAYEGTTTCTPTVVSNPTIERASSPVQGTKLGAYRGTWTNSPTSYAYQWVRCDADGVSNCGDITGKTASTYTPGADDVGKTLRMTVTATNSAGTSSPATGAPSGVVAPAAVPVNTTAPSIKNGASPAATTKLGAQPGRWSGSPTSYAFQWIRCDADGTSNCNDISGKTGSTFVPGAGLVGKTIKLRVTATNGAGSSTPATSAASGVVS